MTTDSLSRDVWRVSLPIILAEASETLLHLIDSIFLARVGVTELGAIAVADSVLLLFLVLPLGLADGIQILTARRAGQRRPEAVGAVFNQGLSFFFNDTATTEIYTLSLHDALPISPGGHAVIARSRGPVRPMSRPS